MKSEVANELIVQEIRTILTLMKTCPEMMTPQALGLLLGQLALNSFTLGGQVGAMDGYQLGYYHAGKSFSIN